MTIDFSEAQFALLKEVVTEYRDSCYHNMFEYQGHAIEVDDDYIKREYTSLAQAEEERFVETKELMDYIEKYEELMKHR